VLREETAMKVRLLLTVLLLALPTSAQDRKMEFRYNGVNVGQAVYLPGTKTVQSAIARSGCFLNSLNRGYDVTPEERQASEATAARQQQRFSDGKVPFLCKVDEGFQDGRVWAGLFDGRCDTAETSRAHDHAGTRFIRPSFLDSPTWCRVVKVLEAVRMRKKRSKGRSLNAQRKAAVRASISFPPDLYNTLEEIAQQKKVSLAWVVREAAEKYIAEKWPLLAIEWHS
jgi:hypothetical protein